MLHGLQLLGLASLIALACIVLGRAIACTIGPRWLQRPSAENDFASAFLGTAFCFIAFGWFSYAGLPARPATIGVVTLAAIIFAAALRNGHFRRLVERPGAARLLLVPISLAVAVLFLPIILNDAYPVFSDSWAYASVAEYLQTHGFGDSVVVDARHPVSDIARHFQDLNQRMGPIFFLAMIESLLPGSAALLILPAVNAWGLTLNVLGIYLLCRWALGADRVLAAGGALLAASAANPLQFSAGQGFFCQTYGTASLAFALAVLARLAAPCRRTPPGALLLAIAAVFVLSAYSELSPILFVAGLGFCARALFGRRARVGIGLFSLVGLTFLATALIGNIEIVRAVRSILLLVGLNTVGTHIPWSGAHYLAFALGVDHFRVQSPYFPWGLVPAGIAFVVGMNRAMLGRRTIPLAFAVLTFVGLAIHLRWWVLDPWTGAVGQTWSLFKLCQWSFPVLAVLQVAGLQILVRRSGWRHGIVFAACLVLGAISVPVHLRHAKDVGFAVRSELFTTSPLTAMRELRQRLAEDGEPPLYVIHDAADTQRCELYAALLARHTFENGWAKVIAGKKNEFVPDEVSGETIFLLPGRPPFERPLETLPCGMSRVDARHGFIATIETDERIEQGPRGDLFVCIGDKPLHLGVWAPRAGVGTLHFDFEGRTTSLLELEVCVGDDRPYLVRCTPISMLTLPLPVRPGLNAVSIQWKSAAASGTDAPVRLSQGRFVMSSPAVPAEAVSRPGSARGSNPPR